MASKTETRTVPHPRHRSFNSLAFAAVVVTTVFAVMVVSGVVLYLAPSGRIAQATGWAMVGLDRAAWEKVHMAFAVLFVIAGLWHLVLNRKALGRFLVDQARQALRLEMALAVAVAALLLLFAVRDWPPVSWLADANTYFKQVYWNPGDLGPAGQDGGAGGGAGRPLGTP